jgi:hypothetical protein
MHMDDAQAVEIGWGVWGLVGYKMDSLRKCTYVLGRVQEDGRVAAY